jgi:hypothetical protein
MYVLSRGPDAWPVGNERRWLTRERWVMKLLLWAAVPLLLLGASMLPTSAQLDCGLP